MILRFYIQGYPTFWHRSSTWSPANPLGHLPNCTETYDINTKHVRPQASDTDNMLTGSQRTPFVFLSPSVAENIGFVWFYEMSLTL